MNRFANAPSDVTAKVRAVVNEAFPQLVNAQILVVFDQKKRSSGDKFIFGRLQKPNDLIKFLTESEENPEGIDYVMYLDQAVFELISDEDRVRLIRHELQHCDVDPDSDNPYKCRDHEITDFYDEIEYNREDPRWMERLGVVAASVYSKDKD